MTCTNAKPPLHFIPQLVGMALTLFLFGATPRTSAALTKLEISKELTSPAGNKYELNLKMLRIERGGAQPVILAHALCLNYWTMLELGNALAGGDGGEAFDLWMPNLRGHGTGSEQTIINPYWRGGYGFDPMVTDDWDTIVNYVASTTGKKPFVVGFSMGGMSSEQWLAGVYQNNLGVVEQSDELARQRAQKIAGFVPLVVPVDFTEVSPTIQKLLSPARPVLTWGHHFLPLTSGLAAAKKNNTYLGWARSGFATVVAPIFSMGLPAGIVVEDNISSEEMIYLLDRFLSQVHTDLLTDFLSWVDKEPYASRTDSISYAKNKKVFAPTLAFFGSEDTLAPAGRGVNIMSQMYPPEAEIRIFYLDGVGHIDIAMEKWVRRVAPRIRTFMTNPDLLGMPPGSMHRIAESDPIPDRDVLGR